MNNTKFVPIYQIRVIRSTKFNIFGGDRNDIDIFIRHATLHIKNKIYLGDKRAIKCKEYIQDCTF